MKTIALFTILSVAFLFNPLVVFAQQPNTMTFPNNPPIIVEGLFGNRGMNYQMLVNKKLKSVPKLGFFSVTNIMTPWKKEVSSCTVGR